MVQTPSRKKARQQKSKPNNPHKHMANDWVANSGLGADAGVYPVALGKVAALWMASVIFDYLLGSRLPFPSSRRTTALRGRFSFVYLARAGLSTTI